MNLFSYRSILVTIAAITLLLPQYDEDLLILKDVMTNVSSSAPNDSFIVNVDIADTLMVGNPSVTLHLLSPDGNSWIDTSLTHLGTLGYENTFGSFLGNGSSSLEWYLTGEIDSEPIFGNDWGRLMFTQLPKAQEDDIPLDDMYYQKLAYTPVNDDFEFIDLDVLGIEGSYSDTKMYYKLTMQGGGFNLGETWGPWPAYLIGFLNPDEGSAAYAFAYANWGNGQILSPGVWKIFFDEETGNVSSFVSAKDSNDNPIEYDLIIDNEEKTLEASFDYISLLDDDDFGNWPNESSALIVLAYTFVCYFYPDPPDDNENGIADIDEMFVPEVLEEIRSTIMLDSYKQDANTPAVLSDPAFDQETGNITIGYQDDEGNLPIMRLLSICPDDEAGSDECVEFTMYPSTHSYYEGATFFKNISNFTFSPGDKLVSFSFTDDLDLISNTTFTITIPEAPGCTDPESCSYDSTANVDDGSCQYFDCFGECGGSATPDCGCGCGLSCDDEDNDNVFDCLDACVGQLDCAGECNGGAVYDECNVCGGDDSTCTGCMDNGELETSPYEYAACNYEEIFSIHSPESCQYPHDLYPGSQPGDYDCYGNFLSNESDLLPGQFIVSKPYPNPFNPTVSIDISVDSPSLVDATIFDARGKIVHAFDKAVYSPGSHTISWTPLDILSGIYFLRMSTDSETVTHKLVLLK